MSYADSIITYSKNIEHHFYPYIAYKLKGHYYYELHEFEKALDYYLRALEIAKDKRNEKEEINIQMNIGILKEKIGKNKEALKLFKEVLNYQIKDLENYNNKRNKELATAGVLNSLVLVANSYRLNKMLDSAQIYNNEIKKYKKKYKKKSRFVNYYGMSTLIDAEIAYAKGEFLKSNQLVNSVLPELILLEDYENIAIAYFVRGRSYEKLGNEWLAIESFLKMDSVKTKHQYFSSELRPGYEFLINDAKGKNNLKEQLYYIEKLLRLDSITYTYSSEISENLITKFDTPNLVAQRTQLKKELSESKNVLSKWILVSTVSFIMLGGVFYSIYQKRERKNKAKQEALEIKFKKQFDLLLEEKRVLLAQRVPEKKHSGQKNEYKKEIEIPQKKIKEILKKLEVFETKKGFKNEDLTAIELAKKMGTNQNYLGRTIKQYKNKSFRGYINDLRVDLALSQLRNNPSFRMFSIHIIAKEVGFKNAEPFSKAFYKKVGMYPSDFIKEMNESYQDIT